MKKKQQQLFYAVFGIFLMLFGASMEIYDIVNSLFFIKPASDLFAFTLDFLVPIALIYCGYHISMQKEFQFPSLVKG